MFFILFILLRDFLYFLMSSALFDFNAIFLKRFLILISLRRAESNHGLSLGLITTDFSGIHSLISVKKVFEKFSAALSISLALDLPDIILEVQHHLSYLKIVNILFGGTDGWNGVHVHVTGNIPQLSSEIVGKINQLKDRPTFLALSEQCGSISM